MPRSPRITTSFAPEMHQAILRWGQERRMTEPAEILRAFVAAHLGGRCADVNAMAFAAAREQALAELREKARGIVREVASRLPR